jgi:hypothetical protein
MTELDRQISVCIDTFVVDLQELIRMAAFESVEAALDLSGNGAPPARGRRGRSAAVAAAVEDRSRGRRSADQLEATGRTVLEYVANNPGQTVEQIGQGLGIHSKELSFPIRKLVSAGELERTGQKRATRYYPSEAGPQSKRKGRRAARGR